MPASGPAGAPLAALAVSLAAASAVADSLTLITARSLGFSRSIRSRQNAVS